MKVANTKNGRIFLKGDGWVVRRIGSKKIFRLFENKTDAVKYASIIALNDRSSVVSHKADPVIIGTVEIIHPIINNTSPIIETITSV